MLGSSGQILSRTLVRSGPGRTGEAAFFPASWLQVGL